MSDTHYKGKDALSHVAEKLAGGTLSSKEIHGLELPSYLHAFADSARDTALSLLLVATLFYFLPLTSSLSFKALALFLLGFVIWKTGRSGWLGWLRLERLHRMMEQEKWEIEHHRPQEREELEVLYTAKGFEGKLLNDVVDVLMADESRLLRVMIEEEMGLQLANLDHPIKQSLGAAIGSLLSGGLLLTSYYFLPLVLFPFIAIFMIAAIGCWVAIKTENKPIDAFVWSASIAALAWGAVYFASGAL